MFVHAHLIKINPLYTKYKTIRSEDFFPSFIIDFPKILFGNQKFWTKIWFDVSTIFYMSAMLTMLTHRFSYNMLKRRNDWREIYRKRDVCCIVWDLRWRVFLIFDCFDSISHKFYSINICEEWLFVYLWFFPSFTGFSYAV